MDAVGLEAPSQAVVTPMISSLCLVSKDRFPLIEVGKDVLEACHGEKREM